MEEKEPKDEVCECEMVMELWSREDLSLREWEYVRRALTDLFQEKRLQRHGDKEKKVLSCVLQCKRCKRIYPIYHKLS